MSTHRRQRCSGTNGSVHWLARRALSSRSSLLHWRYMCGLREGPGPIRALPFNVMVVAGASTVLFTGTPLLRYDGYYILSDVLEIPNLARRASRYWGHLVERYVFRTDGLPEFVATPGERFW